MFTPTLIGLIGGVVGALLLVVVILAAWSYKSRQGGKEADPEQYLSETSKAHTIMVRSTKFTNGKPLSFNGTPAGSHEMSPVLGQADPAFPGEVARTRGWAESGNRGSVGSPQESRLVMPEADFGKSEGSSPSREMSSNALDEKLVKSADTKLGTLDFSVAYDSQKNMLMVTINRANDLPPQDLMLGTSDPYIKLQLLPEKRHRVKTRVLRRTLNPVYDETFTFYGITPAQVKQLSLHFVVLSFDRFSRDDIIGEVLCTLADRDVLDKELPLQIEIHPRQLKIRNQQRGEMLVSLCYQPAANRLTVVVLKARNLPKMDVTGLAGDPYVKIYLLCNGQRVAKKKTHVKKRTLNPVYNESFVFEVPGGSLENVSLEFLLLDWDRVTKNEIIGRLEIGAKKSENVEAHWKQVVENPRKQIAEWHKLSE